MKEKPMPNDPMQDILADLPKIQAIADGPMRANPLLAMLLQQAGALAQISAWAQNAQAGVNAPKTEEPPSAPDDAVTEEGS